MFNIHEQVLAYLKEEENQTESENRYIDRSDTNEKRILQQNEASSTIDDILNYSKRYAFQVVDNRKKGGALWVYHDKDNTIHALEFKQMGMNYKAGRGWWINEFKQNA